MEEKVEGASIAGLELNGQRLDAALAVFFPSLGLRGRRRLWNENQVLVDGIARSPAFRLRGGETIHLAPRPLADQENNAFPAFAADPPRLIARQDKLFFIYKPSMLHTASLAGSSKRSLASLLERIVPDAPPPCLLTRLDQQTSGIVIAAEDENAARLWRSQENAGVMEKDYLAVLEGRLDSESLARNALDFAETRRTFVLDTEGDRLRHTRIRPLAHFQTADAPDLVCGCPDGAWFTLALCRIVKGARHQIRAHAAHIGHPLSGDRLYGARHGISFFLHHYRIQWPEGRLSCLPSWYALLPAPVREQEPFRHFLLCEERKRSRMGA